MRNLEAGAPDFKCERSIREAMVTLVTDSEQDGHADEVCFPHNGEQIYLKSPIVWDMNVSLRHYSIKYLRSYFIKII